MLVKLHGKSHDIGIIQVYAPTSDHDDEVIDSFYEDIEQAKSQLKSKDICIIMGDFNAKVGSQRIDGIVGPHGLGEINSRGEQLVQWCKQHNMLITNTWFKNHKRRCWTWKSPGDRIRNQIDFILASKRFQNSILASKSMPSADCNSDHIPVVCKFKFKPKRIRKPSKLPKLQLNLLKTDSTVKHKFTNSLKENLVISLENNDIEDTWHSIKDAVTKTMRKSVPLTTKKNIKNG